MSKQVKVIEGVSFFERETAEGNIEVHATTLPETAAAIQYKIKEGYELCLDPSDTNNWPFKAGRINYLFFKKAGEAKVEIEKPTIQVAKVSNISVSTEELLDGPDFESIGKLSKQAIEDEADRWSIQLDTANSKKVMLEEFEKAWKDKA